MHPAEAPAAISRNNCPKPRCAERRDPPVGWVSVLRGDETGLQISSWAFPGALLEFFGGGRRLPRAILERFYDLLRAVLGPTCWLKRFWTNFEAISARCWTPQTSKFKVFAWRVCILPKNHKFRNRAQKVCSGAPRPPPNGGQNRSQGGP